MSQGADDNEGETGTAYCINCGEEIPAETEFCPECGSSQDPNQMEASEEATEGSGFTSWAPGFKPGSTFRNILIGIAYILFFYIGIFLLVYGYIKENPESGSKFAWVLGILLILAGLGGFTDGTTRGIIGGIVAVVIGIVALPIVRDKIGFGSPPPGIEEGNTARRNALISVGYGIGALVIAGAALPESESSSSPSGGSTASSGGDGGGSDSASSGGSGSGGGGSSNQGQPEGTRWYDSNLQIGVMEGVEAEMDSIGNMYIRGIAENFSNTDYEYVQLSFEVYDESNTKIADGLANTNGLSAGQRWRFEALAPGAEGADSYRLTEITAY